MAAHAVATKLGDHALASSANAAYAHGMSVVLLVVGVTSLVTALPAAALLPRTAQATGVAPVPGDARE
ncbi:hypothetical protein [Streptomyces sp. NPDC058695]|uniref:hypothetical protein n=1 Tax=Streptomyces sp. NPDC058695 TaxID=3346604 RepID=UPI003669D9A5